MDHDDACSGLSLATASVLPHAASGHKGWNSRGYLPHFDHPEKVQSLTFHLGDSVPSEIVEEWKRELQVSSNVDASDPRMVELRRRIEKYADAGYGECWLRRLEVGGMVEDALLFFDGVRYRLLAWCVMPNHVHALVEMVDGWPLRSVVHSWKSFTSKEANRVLGRTGSFWEKDYYDRFIRDEGHLENAVRYIEENPLKAGLVRRGEDWLFSSATLRVNAGGTPALPGAGASR